jgi:hypothetical protein
MSKLIGWTDEDVSFAILMSIHGKEIDHWCVSDCEKFIYDCGPIGDEFHKIDLIDYCNSWADMGPLIESTGITIGPCTSGGKMAACYRGGFDDITAFSGRTLRAAAEVYLMVKGAA